MFKLMTNYLPNYLCPATDADGSSYWYFPSALTDLVHYDSRRNLERRNLDTQTVHEIHSLMKNMA